MYSLRLLSNDSIQRSFDRILSIIYKFSAFLVLFLGIISLKNQFRYFTLRIIAYSLTCLGIYTGSIAPLRLLQQCFPLSNDTRILSK